MNRRRRLPQAENLTPQAYRCPACCITARMLVVWPSWVCQVCKAKLVPADLHPRPSEQRLPGPARHETDIVIDLPASQPLDSPASEPDVPAEQPEQREKEASG